MKDNLKSFSEVKVSIIIPHYNNSRYLNDCLSSIAMQSHKNVEIIIIDDCSGIEEVKAANIIAKKYDCILNVNSENAGVAYTRNRGILSATGDIITTIDPDDYFLGTDYLECVVKSYLNSKSQVIGAKIVYVNEEKKILTRKSKTIISGWVKARLFSRSMYIPHNIFYTPAMFEKVGGYNPVFKAYEDWDFKIRLSNQFKFKIENIEVAYRIHEEGLSTLSRLSKINQMLKVFVNNFSLLSFKDGIVIFSLLIVSFPRKIKSISGLKKY